ncbi:MAG: hypothetical protein WC787_03450 [Patescibacteria group bacterium]|jgi:hypothetical protein
MSKLTSFWSKLLPFKRPPRVDRYHVTAVTNPVELEIGEQLPIEIRYVLAVRPSRHEAFRKLLEKGYGIGVRTVDKTPERVLQAVDRISQETQHNTIIPWLERLLRHEELPVFSEEELRNAERKGINLYEEVRIILGKRYEFKKIILIPLENQGLTESEQVLMREVNEDLYPHAIDVIVNRVTFDNAHTRTEVAQSIIKALLIVGPVAHVLEHVLAGIGKVFAATADDLLSETAELFALRGSGFSWRQLAKRSRILIPVFILATYGAFQVESLIHDGRLALAGVVFGLSAVALSLTTAIQSIFLYKSSYASLVREGKLRLEPGKGLFSYALRQDFTNPARLGLFVGAVASPIMAAIVFSFFPELTKNGWVLALLGSTESVVASLTVMAAAHVNRAVFQSRVRRAIQSRIR